MSFDDAIAHNTFVVHCVLPFEFDASRRRLLFESNADGDLISPDHVVLDIAPFEPYANNGAQQATDHHAHEKIVMAALHAIQRGTLDKVVVSCIKHAPRASTPLEIIFERLTERYPTAFVYMLHHPKYGTWMGATPELLLHKDGETFRTVSLAGTQPFRAEPGLIWSEKLQHEQQVVTDFIVEKLSGIRSHALELNGPFTAQAGPLAHLKTDIRFHSDQSSEAIIGELQPTPAVCGLPRERALAFILENTNFDRRLYAGRIGIHMPTGEEIHFVNLRCMQVFDDHFELHVGGGIVAGSNAADEWHETEIKANVLRNLLE
jgi:isochorismate synthase